MLLNTVVLLVSFTLVASCPETGITCLSNTTFTWCSEYFHVFQLYGDKVYHCPEHCQCNTLTFSPCVCKQRKSEMKEQHPKDNGRPTCTENIMTPGPTCVQYNKCINNVRIMNYCNVGLYYDPYLRDCTKDAIAFCSKEFIEELNKFEQDDATRQ